MTHINLGAIYENRGDVKDAQGSYQEAIRLLDELTGKFPDNRKYQRGKALCHTNLGVLFANIGRTIEAEEQIRLALPIRESLAKDNPGVSNYRNDLADTQTKLGFMAMRPNPKLAVQLLSSALRMRKELTQEFPSVPEFRLGLARTHELLAIALVKDAQRDKSVVHLRAALAVSRELVKDFPSTKGCQYTVAKAHVTLALALSGRGLVKESNAQFREGLAAIDELLSTDTNLLTLQWYELAGASANASQISRDPNHKERFAAAAVKLLSGAIKSGGRLNPKTHPVFRLLRNRDDFRQLLIENGWEDAN